MLMFCLFAGGQSLAIHFPLGDDEHDMLQIGKKGWRPWVIRYHSAHGHRLPKRYYPSMNALGGYLNHLNEPPVFWMSSSKSGSPSISLCCVNLANQSSVLRQFQIDGLIFFGGLGTKIRDTRRTTILVAGISLRGDRTCILIICERGLMTRERLKRLRLGNWGEGMCSDGGGIIMGRGCRI